MRPRDRFALLFICFPGSLALFGPANAVTPSSVSLPSVPRPQWTDDWIWGAPLVAITIVIHVAGLSLINRLIAFVPAMPFGRRHRTSRHLAMGAVALLATLLHGFEAVIWALAYFLLGALSDLRDAMLFSLNAITTYGHDTLRLEKHWQLMGALEALSGILAFGLTTAFLFLQMRRLWPSLSMAAGDQPDHEGRAPQTL